MNPYVGHPSQLCSVEEHQLLSGKGRGMRLFEVINGCGMEMTLSPDRNLDIQRLRVGGINLSYFSPCGYVAPEYFDGAGDHWLRSFTAGFLTTCGLEAVGSPCEDDGETLGLHGSIANTPCEHAWWTEDEQAFRLCAETRDERIFGRKFMLRRGIAVSKRENSFTLTDEIENTGDQVQPIEVLYHMNMGYPLLDEDSEITIPSCRVLPRDDHAAEDIAHWMRMEKPTPGYQERCYYHQFDKEGAASIFQPKLGIRLTIRFDPKELDGFVEWKMMGVRDYVLGLECGNCYPDGRDVMRKTGMLKFLAPGEKKRYQFTVTIES